MRIKIQALMQKISMASGFHTYAAVLLLTMAGAYTLLAGKMGFYYDDWEGVFLYQQGFSASQVWEYFLIDRPFSSLAHWLFHPIAGVSPLGWNVLILLLHWGGILFFVKSLLTVFPKQTIAAGWTGLLLGLYPGILRHFVPRTSAPHYLSFFLFALSLWLMLMAYQTKRKRVALLVLSTIFALAQALIIEYFATMEIARLFILLAFFYQRENLTRLQLFKRAFQAWIPYLLVFIAFLVFKFQVLPGLAQAEQLQAKHDISLLQQFLDAPAQTAIAYANLVVQDIVHAVFYVWSLPIIPADINLAATTTVVSWLLGAVMASLCAVILWAWYCRENNPAANESPPAKTALALFLVIILLGGLPAWLLGRQAVSGTWSSRFLFAQILGGVPLLVVMVLAATGYTRQYAANVILAILLAASFSLQFREARKYVTYWDAQQNFYWQLKWRAPGLEPQVFIVSSNTPVPKNSGYQIAYVINLLYAPGYAETASLHWWFNGTETLWDSSKMKYHPNKNVQASMRNITFESNMRYALPVLYQPARGCLQILTDTYYLGESGLSANESNLFALAGNDLIQTQGPPMSASIFGKEPPHTWCYYYQKAELARQQNDWDEVLRLWQASKEQQLAATYGPEYLPFVEANTRAGNWVEARQVTIKAGKTTKDARPFLCTFWQETLKPLDSSGESEPEWEKVKHALDCP